MDGPAPIADFVPVLSNWRAARSTETLQRDFSDPDFDDSDWLPIEVPSHWQTQPGFEDFDGTLLYRADLRVPALQAGQRRWLRFDGLCYTGDVFLDGAYVGQTEGYFTHHRFDVTDLTSRSGTYTLAVEVGAPRETPGERKRAITGWFTEAPGTPPTWNPAGIWQPVSIVDTGAVAIRHFRATCVAADERRAEIALRAVLFADDTADIELVTEVAGTSDVSTHRVSAGENQVEWHVSVPLPELWWPHERGEQPMYPLSVQARIPNGTISDRKYRRIGFRTTSMRDFILRINGERVFARGINVGPIELDLASASVDAMRDEILAIREAGFNFIRVRSHVNRVEFYDLCDDLGMMVWQDFPLIGAYVRGITDRAEAQAREMVDFLSHHPSIVVWGGHYRPHTDEPRTTSAPDLRRQQMPSWNRSILDRAVSGTMRGDDPSRRTVAHSEVAPHIPQLRGSDLGQFFGWFDRPASELAEYAAALPRFVRFVSDMGSQALPEHIEKDLDALLDVAGAEVEALHAVIPASDYAEASNWVKSTRHHQADVLKTSIETLRALKYRPVGGFCAGLWRGVGPGLSRALIDHDGTPRPALDAAKTALQPVLPILYPPEPTLHAHHLATIALHICNDRDEDLELTVTATITDQRGTSIKQWQGLADADAVSYLGDIEVRGGRIGQSATVELLAEGSDGRWTNRYVISAT
ncbi:MAG: hypothetical protein HKN94_04060 [Acidimicrobiales bacterium]|nr:hypothetical protein [Acidimicrobiales bacterium]